MNFPTTSKLGQNVPAPIFESRWYQFILAAEQSVKHSLKRFAQQVCPSERACKPGDYSSIAVWNV